MDYSFLCVNELGLSTRSSNALQRAGIMTVGDLLAQTEESLLNISNLGAKSVAEILEKIAECRSGSLDAAREGKQDCPNVSIDELPLLSARAGNILRLNGHTTLPDVALLSEAELMKLAHMDAESAREIARACRTYLRRYENACETEAPSLETIVMLPGNRETVLRYVRHADAALELLGLSNRAFNQLCRNGYAFLSDILFLTAEELRRIPHMGEQSVQSVIACRSAWMQQHAAELNAIFGGADPESLVPVPGDDEVRDMLLRLYADAPLAGLSLQDFRQGIPERVETDQLKRCVGRLLAEKQLEYVDFRCYRLYPRFEDAVRECTAIDEKNRDILLKRIHGHTLESIAQELGRTRERIRQVTSSKAQRVRSWQVQQDTVGVDGKTDAAESIVFDEDYYRYFYSTYDFEKADASRWFGISESALGYLALICKTQGKASLDGALEDHNIDAALRQRVRNYLNRNKLYLNGHWVPKKRAELEQYYIERYCTEDVSFNEFRDRYNAFLESEGIPFDESVYETDETAYSRKNHLSEARYLLWKYGERLRAYDIDGRDYTVLFSELGLDVLENIEISTQKLMEEHPDILAQYDIRDQYELHNLLRKTLPDGSFHGLTIRRTPNILFGSFDRDRAILDLMRNNAPISQADLAELIHREYGFDEYTIIGSYLTPIAAYYHHGMYTIEQKTMSDAHRAALLDALDDDFYFIDELKRIYARAVPGADVGEINPFTLKQMGFSVFSSCVLRRFSSLNGYFRALLTGNDLLELTALRRRFARSNAFYATLLELKRSLEVIEYEPDKLISFRRLAAAGVTRESIRQFCDAVWDYVDEGAFFSAVSLRLSGFTSELYELGFSDWFYANLLLSDRRFSFGLAFRSIILRKGGGEVTIRAFETSLIRDAGSMDVYDLQRLMQERYGCVISDRLDLIYKVDGGAVYYDRYLDRLYDTEERYQRELDRMEDG